MRDRSRIAYLGRSGATRRTSFIRQGAGTPVVLIHGVGMQSSIWEPQIDVLARDFDVLALDMLGHGESSLPSARPGLCEFAEQVAALLDALALDRAHIVGHSMGALVAVEFALTYQDRVITVSALNPVFCRTQDQRTAVTSRASALDPSSGFDWTPTITRWFGSPIRPSWQEAAAAVSRALATVDPVGYARAYGLFATADAAHRDRLCALEVPSLFMTGEDDANSLPSMSTAMAALARRGTVEIVPDERHMMALTVPAKINARLTSFFGLSGPAPSGARSQPRENQTPEPVLGAASR